MPEPTEPTESAEPDYGWPYPDCPEGCRQRTCPHKPLDYSAPSHVFTVEPKPNHHEYETDVGPCDHCGSFLVQYSRTNWRYHTVKTVSLAQLIVLKLDGQFLDVPLEVYRGD